MTDYSKPIDIDCSTLEATARVLDLAGVQCECEKYAGPSRFFSQESDHHMCCPIHMYAKMLLSGEMEEVPVFAEGLGDPIAYVRIHNADKQTIGGGKTTLSFPTVEYPGEDGGEVVPNDIAEEIFKNHEEVLDKQEEIVAGQIKAAGEGTVDVTSFTLNLNDHDEMGGQLDIVEHEMYPIFEAVIRQAMFGKGERHGGAATPFYDQPWYWYSKMHGRGFLTGQAAKKLEEAASKRDGEPFIHEVMGAIVYCAMSILAEQEVMQKELSAENEEVMNREGL